MLTISIQKLAITVGVHEFALVQYIVCFRPVAKGEPGGTAPAKC